HGTGNVRCSRISRYSTECRADAPLHDGRDRRYSAKGEADPRRLQAARSAVIRLGGGGRLNEQRRSSQRSATLPGAGPWSAALRITAEPALPRSGKTRRRQGWARKNWPPRGNRG